MTFGFAVEVGINH